MLRCRVKHGQQGGKRMSFGRVIIFFNSMRNIFLLYCGVLLLAALGYAFFEHENLAEALWWAVVTAMTVGYGDTYPDTWGGRIVGVILMHLMIFVIGPLIIGQIASRMIVNRDAFTHEEQEWIKQKLQELERERGEPTVGSRQSAESP
jgi:voltage-gated potassium channel